MAETFIIRGFWGPRAEGDAGLAERTGSLLGRLDALLPGGVDRWDLPKGDPVAVADHAGLASYVRELAEEARRESPGLGIVFVSSGMGSDGAWFRVTLAAGGTALGPGLMNSVVVKLAWPAGDVDAQLAMACDALVALVEEWDPDWGDIYTRRLRDGLRDRVEARMRAPSPGYSVYLSSLRCEAARAVSLPGRQWELAGGGVVSVDSERGSLPSVDQVLALDQALASSGAFEPTPVDSPHIVERTVAISPEAGS